jgi:hypothetical protein
VQTVEPWSPPDTWANLSTVALNAALTEIDAGLPNGQRFSSASAAKDRAAWRIVQKHCLDKTELQCRQIVNTWVKTGLLYNQDYDDPVDRKSVVSRVRRSLSYSHLGLTLRCGYAHSCCGIFVQRFIDNHFFAARRCRTS